MCAVSAIGQYWANTFPQRYPNYGPITVPMYPIPGGVGVANGTPSIGVSYEEFQALKKDVAELKELLLAAKKFDEVTKQPDCHMEEKVELIRNVARLVGIDMKDIFPDGDAH